jgi:hypothetical protein
MADITSLKNNVTRAQYAFDAINAKLNGQWGPSNEIERLDIGTPQYKAALKEYKKLKPNYEAAKKALDNAKSAYQKEVDASQERDTKNSERNKANDAIDRANQVYQKALDIQDPSRIAEAKAVLDQAKLNATTSPIETNTQPPVTGEPAADGTYAQYSIQNGQVYTMAADNKLAPIYLVTLPKPANYVGASLTKEDTIQTPFDGVASARDAFIKAYYVGDAKIKELQNKLLADRWITQDQIARGTWVSGVDDFIAAYTLHSVAQGQYNGVKDSKPINSFFGVLKGGSTKTPKQYRTFSTRGEAKQLLDTYYTDLIGRTATAEEQADFFDKLHTAENKAVSTVTGRTTVGSTLVDADRMVIAAQVAKVSLKGTDAETILSNKAGSQVAIDIANLQKNAAAYGQTLSAAEAFKLVANNVGQKDFLNKQTERLRQLSITMNPNLAQHIKDGGTVKEVADSYAYTKARKLGVVVPDSIADKDVMNAITQNGGLMTMSDFNRQMQADPRWRKTEEAQNIAADFTSTILQSFGFGG